MTAQKIVDEVADSHAGAPPQRVKDALRDTWAGELPDHSPPLLPDDKADEYAKHISAGRDIVVSPAERPLTSESGVSADEPVLAGLPRLERRQRSLLLATVLCYLRGYPLALSVAPAIGWTLVKIGGCSW